jgi:hypothetical protein
MPTAPEPSLRPLAWARVAFAAVVLIRTTPLIRLIDPMIGGDVHTLMGWPSPAGGLRAAAFGWELRPGVVMALCVLRTVAAALLLVGWRPLLSGLVTGLVGYVVMVQDVFSFTFTQTLLFVGSAVLATTDCAAELSVRREPARSPRTSLYLVWAFVTSIYFWAAFCKLRRDWLDGRALGLFYDEGKLRGPLADLLLGTAARRAVAGTAVAATELALVALLWAPRTRVAGLVIALGLHVTIEQIARPDVFGWAMLSLLLSFVPLARERDAEPA